MVVLNMLFGGLCIFYLTLLFIVPTKILVPSLINILAILKQEFGLWKRLANKTISIRTCCCPSDSRNNCWCLLVDYHHSNRYHQDSASGKFNCFSERVVMYLCRLQFPMAFVIFSFVLSQLFVTILFIRQGFWTRKLIHFLSVLLHWGFLRWFFCNLEVGMP